MSSLDLSRPAGDGAVTTARSWSLTVEQLAYLALGVVSLLAHLWALDARALHHDETLHAAYSWYLYVGRGYIHDPLLHGPLLYYLGALGYFLFGDGDTTARLMPALAGTALTLTPYLVRRELGRPAALIATVYLLISPVTLYVGRFFRHDIYSMLCEALVFAAIVRYSTTRRPAWLIVGAAAFGLMLVNQETSYLFLLIMGAPLTVAFLWRVYKPGIAIVGALGVAVAALIFVLPGEAKVDGAHHAIIDPATGQMQVEQPGLLGWPPLATEDNGYALLVRNRADDDSGRNLFTNLVVYVGDLLRFFSHPAVLVSLGLVLAVAAALVYLIWRRPGPSGRTPWQAARDRGDPAAAVYASLAEGGRWKVALAVFFGIYLVFFTALFTNLLGALSGVFGSLLYWLAQHNVERGGQPEHYYLFQLAVYEPLLLIFGSLGLVLLARDLFKMRQKAPEPPAVDHDSADVTASSSLPLQSQDRAAQPIPQGHFSLQPSAFSLYLLAWWAIAALGIYTWAGEKMPWLTIHIVLPWILLAAWAAQRVIWKSEGETHLPQRAAVVLYSCLFAAIVGLSFVLMTAIVGFGEASVLAPWVVPVAAVLLVALLTTGTGLRWGWRPAAALCAVCLGVALGLYTARSSFRLVYLNGDVPVEPMVYTQTSPDVLRVVNRLEEASIKRGQGLAMPIIYDNETVWGWYLRDFENAERNNGDLTAPPGPEVMAVVMLQENLDRNPANRDYLEGFVIQRYPLRWWFPEDQVYRLGPGWREAPLDQTSLLAQLLRDPFDRGVGERWWRFLMFRDPAYPLGSTDFVVAVRPGLASQIGVGLGGDLRGETAP